MAIKVSGTEVVSDSRELNNITGIDATTKETLESNLTVQSSGPVSVIPTAENFDGSTTRAAHVVPGGLKPLAKVSSAGWTYGNTRPESADYDHPGSALTAAVLDPATSTATFTVQSGAPKDDLVTSFNNGREAFYFYDPALGNSYYSLWMDNLDPSFPYYRFFGFSTILSITETDNGDGTFDVVVSYDGISGQNRSDLSATNRPNNLPLAIGGDLAFRYVPPSDFVIQDPAFAETLLPTVGTQGYVAYFLGSADGKYFNYNLDHSQLTRNADGTLSGVTFSGSDDGVGVLSDPSGEVVVYASEITQYESGNTTTLVPRIRFWHKRNDTDFVQSVDLQVTAAQNQFGSTNSYLRFDAQELYNLPSPEGLFVDTFDLIEVSETTTWGSWSSPSVADIFSRTYALGDTNLATLYNTVGLTSSIWQMRNAVVLGHQHGLWEAPADTATAATGYFEESIVGGYRIGRSPFSFSNYPTFLPTATDSVLLGSYGLGAGDTVTGSVGSTPYFNRTVSLGYDSLTGNDFGGFTPVYYSNVVSIGQENYQDNSLFGTFSEGFNTSVSVGNANHQNNSADRFVDTVAVGEFNITNCSSNSSIAETTAVGKNNLRGISVGSGDFGANSLFGNQNAYSFSAATFSEFTDNLIAGSDNFSWSGATYGTVDANTILGHDNLTGLPATTNIQKNFFAGTEISRNQSYTALPSLISNVVIGTGSFKFPNEADFYTDNVSIGRSAGSNLYGGPSGQVNGNVAIGPSAGSGAGFGASSTANSSTFLGALAGTNSQYANNVTCLGADSQVTGDQQVQLGSSSVTVYAQSAVQTRSDGRDKTDVRDTVLGLDFIEKLRPVDFRWDMRDDYYEEVEVEQEVEVTKKVPNPEYLPPRERFTRVANPDYIPPKERFVEIDNPDWTPASSEPEKIRVLMEDYSGGEEEFLSVPMGIPDGDIRLQEFLEKTVTETKTVMERRELPKDGSKKRTRFHHGVLAQDVEAIIAETGVDFGGYQDHSVNGGKDVKSVGYTELVGPLIKAVQELSDRVKNLEAQLNP